MGDNSFPIHVWSGLIEAKHVKAMGSAVWEYLWCLDRQTTPDGLVLGGKPVQLKEIAEVLGRHRITTCTNLHRLERHKYLELKRISYGFIIRVLKPKKYQRRRVSQNTNSEREDGVSEMTNSRKENANSRKENANSRSDMTVDMTVDMTGEPAREVQDCLAILSSVPGYPLDKQQDAEMIAEFAVDFPTLALKEEFRQWKAYKRDHPLTEKSSPRAQLRNWLRKAVEFEKRDKRRPPTADEVLAKYLEAEDDEEADG